MTSGSLNEFQRKTKVTKSDYWQGHLNGNACSIIQKHSQFIIDYDDASKKIAVNQIGKVLNISGQIRKKLYTVGYMTPANEVDVKKLFKELKDTWRQSEELERHSLLKLHYLLNHSLDFIDSNGGYLLGVFAEQEFESTHKCFKKRLKYYPVKDKRRLEKAIACWNAVRFEPP